MSPGPGLERLKVTIQGAVQGVGFRPFVYRLATELALAGWVVNDARGVVLEVEGPRASLERFLVRLPRRDAAARRASTGSSPSGSRPSDSAVRDPRTATAGGERSGGAAARPGDLPRLPGRDRATRASRRHRYPFTNCTNCGPRFIDHPRAALRPAEHDDGAASRCARPAGASTTTRATGASTPSRSPARRAGRSWRCGTRAARCWPRATRRCARAAARAARRAHRRGQGPGRLPPGVRCRRRRGGRARCASARPARRSRSR